MESCSDRRKMSKGRGALEPGDVAERAAVAHSGQQQFCGVDVPAASHPAENTAKIRSVGVVPHQGPGAASRGGRDDDGTKAARLAQPAAQETAAIPAAAMP